MNAPEADVANRWECGECGLVEGHRMEGTDEVVQIDAVCHHCGKPLCREDQHFITDDAFSRKSPVDLPQACHCSACRRRHGYPRAV